MNINKKAYKVKGVCFNFSIKYLKMIIFVKIIKAGYWTCLLIPIKTTQKQKLTNVYHRLGSNSIHLHPLTILMKFCFQHKLSCQLILYNTKWIFLTLDN